ncbi:MAG TPA: sulfatase-like hydrolase/transferase [Verrucomicrobiae bacterium]|nr:sulfatase-like hydrolase/transferase [Verrucomicrobiae bacterium]
MSVRKNSSGEVTLAGFPSRRNWWFTVGVLSAIFGVELFWSVVNWHRSSRTGLTAASVYSAAFLTFFWMTVLFGIEVFCRVAGEMEKKIPAPLNFGRKVLFSTLVAGAWAFVVLSLVTRYVLGCYLNLSLLRFAQANMSHGLWTHMVGSQQWMLVIVLLFLLVSCSWIVLQTWRMSHGLNLLGSVKGRRTVLVLWLAASAAFTFATTSLNRTDKAFRAKMTSHLSYNLDPILTFVLNCYDFQRQTQYEDRVLEESELKPRSAPFHQPATAMSDKPSIILFRIESFRSDLVGQRSQGIEIVPTINRLAGQGTFFKNAYAPASHTSLSNPSIPASLYPLRKDMLVAYQADDPWPKTLIYDVLKPYGYATGWFSSDIESWCGMDTFLVTPALDCFVDSSSRKLKELELHPEQRTANVQAFLVPDRLTATSAIEWIKPRLEQKQPFFVNISFADSHYPYHSSNQDAHWFQPCGVEPGWAFGEYPRTSNEQVRNTYFNAMHGIDLLIGEILQLLHQSGADQNTIVAIYGDHGESFYENDLAGHAKLPFNTAIRTGLVLWGRHYFEPKADPYPTSLIDAVPTILARLGLAAHPNFQGIDVLSPNRPSAERRCVYVHVDGIVNSDGLVAAGRWKYFEDNSNGDCYLFDLEHDPAESANLMETQPEIAELLRNQLSAWRAGQLAYYRSARYYTRFFPPTPRQLPGDEQTEPPSSADSRVVSGNRRNL